MKSLEPCTKESIILLKHRTRLCLLYSEGVAAMGDRGDVTLAPSVTGLQVEKPGVGDTIFQEMTPGFLPGNYSGQRGKA